MRIQCVPELIAYQKAYELAMRIYTVTKVFPRNDQYELTDQIRRSSRAVCACLAEAWAKRRYEAHFISKLTDADAENNETAVWLDFAHDCGYLASPDHQALRSLRAEVGAMLGGMLRKPGPFLLKPWKTEGRGQRTEDRGRRAGSRGKQSGVIAV